MNRASLHLRVFAEHLIAFEARQKPSAKVKTQTAFPEFEKLRPHLATLMGNAGYRALLMRARSLAGLEVPWLREAQISAAGSLTAPNHLEETVAAKAQREGRVLLLAQLLGLLVAFIGEKLTHQLLLDVWPNLSLNDLNPRKEDPS